MKRYIVLTATGARLGILSADSAISIKDGLMELARSFGCEIEDFKLYEYQNGAFVLEVDGKPALMLDQLLH